MSEVKLSAAKRTEFGKGAARRLRRAQQVPAVIYGHGTDPVHVSLPGHATMLALKQSNALLTLDVEGSPTLALHITGNPAPGTLVTNELNSLSVEVDAAAIPNQITFDISGAQPGTTISAGQITLPEGATLVTDADATALHFASATQDLADESAESAAE